MGTGGSFKIKTEKKINNLIENLQRAIYALDMEFGNGENIPKFLPLGNSKFELSFSKEEKYIFTIEKVK